MGHEGAVAAVARVSGGGLTLLLAPAERQWWALGCCGFWVAVIAIALARFGWQLYRYIRLRSRMDRRDANRCPECGYDLRGGHDRCPECGTDVVPNGSSWWRKG